MSEKWQIDRVSISERFFDKINNEMVQPVGIVLFGADCDFKKDVYARCVEKIGNLAAGYGGKAGMPLRDAGQAFLAGKNVLTIMDGDSAIYQTCRRDVAAKLREFGAKRVVGVYAKVEKTPYCKNIATWGILHRQIETLLQSPPTGSIFDYPLITFRQKKKEEEI